MAESGALGVDEETTQFLWPPGPEGGSSQPIASNTLGIVFNFETAGPHSEWECKSISISPLEGFDSIEESVLRGIPLSRMLRQGRAGIWSSRIIEARILADAHMAEGVPFEDIEWPPPIDKQGRRKLAPDGKRWPSPKRMEHLRKVAAIYEAEEARETTERKQPVRTVAERLDLPLDTASKQIKRCRGLGLIKSRPHNAGNRTDRSLQAPTEYSDEYLREVARVYNAAKGDPLQTVMELLELKRADAEAVTAECTEAGLVTEAQHQGEAG